MEKASPTQTQKNEDAEDADDDDDGDAKKYALPSMINSEWRPADGNGEAISEASWKSDLFTNSCMEIEQKTGERILERDCVFASQPLRYISGLNLCINIY